MELDALSLGLLCPSLVEESGTLKELPSQGCHSEKAPGGGSGK